MKERVENIGPRFNTLGPKDKDRFNGSLTFEDDTGCIWVNIDLIDQRLKAEHEKVSREYDEYLQSAGEYASPDLFDSLSLNALNGHREGLKDLPRVHPNEQK